MVVYIEVVLLENLLIDGLLLWLVLQCLKIKTNWWGLVLASTFGAGFALASPSIAVEGFFAFLIKVGIAVIMSIMLCLDFKKLWLKTLLFVLFTFCFGGVMLSVFSFMGVSTTTGLALGYNAEIPLGAMVAGSLIFVLVNIYLVKRFYKRRKLAQFFYDIQLTVNSKQTTLRGFLDTGNTLDNAQGKPIIVVGSKQLKCWFDTEEQLELIMGKYGGIGLQNAQNIVVQSVGGKEKILVFDAQCVFKNKSQQVAVGICSNNQFFKRGFEAILSPKLLEG